MKFELTLYEYLDEYTQRVNNCLAC